MLEFWKTVTLAAGVAGMVSSAMAGQREIVMNVDFCDIIGCKWVDYKKGNEKSGGYTEEDIRAMLHRCKLGGCDSVNWRVASLGVCLHPTEYYADIAFISKWSDEKKLIELDRRFTEDWMHLSDRFRGSYALTQAATPDTLAVAADACRKEGLKLFFWVDLHDEMFGRFVNEHPECLVKTKDGAVYPGVRDYGNEEAVKEKLLELEELYKYRPDGFYFCTSAHTRHCRFDEPDGAFGTLKAETFTAFLRRVRESMRPHGFKLIMGTGCAGRLDFCTPYFSEHVKYAIQHDWRTWIDKELVDGIVCGDYERMLEMYGGWSVKGVYSNAPGRTPADIFLPEFTRYNCGRVKLYYFSDWLFQKSFERTLSAATDQVLTFGLDGMHIHEEMLIDGFKGGWDAVREMRGRFDAVK